MQQQQQDHAGTQTREEPENLNDMREVTDYADLYGAYSEDFDCNPTNHIVTKVDIRVKNIYSTHLISKVLLTDQNQTALCVKVITSQKNMTLVV